jgi:hypothetical protein
VKIKPTPPDLRTFPVLERYSRGAVSAADAAWEIQALNIPGCEDPSASEVILWSQMAGFGIPTPTREEAEREADELLERQRDAHDRRTF